MSIAVTLDSKWLEENRNKKYGQSFLEQTKDYSDTAIGTFRGLQLTQKITKAANLALQLANSSSEKTKELSENLGSALGAVGLLRVPGALSQSYASLKAAGESINRERKILTAFKDVAEATATCGAAVIYTTGNLAMKPVAQVAGITSNVADFGLSLSGYQRAAGLEPFAVGEAKKVVTHSKNYFLLRTVKTVMAIASTLFGVMFIAHNGLASTPIAFALALFSLAATISAIATDYFKNRGEYKLLDFDRVLTVVG